MTSILISRVIMNLRGVYTPGVNAVGSLHLSRFSDVRFANSIVGNLGAPLAFEEEHRTLTNGPEGKNIPVVNISDDPLTEYLPSPPKDASSAAPEDAGTSN